MIEQQPAVAIVSSSTGEHGGVSPFRSPGRAQRKRRPTRPEHDGKRSTGNAHMNSSINGCPNMLRRARIWRENHEGKEVEQIHRRECQIDAGAAVEGAGCGEFGSAKKDDGVMTIDMIVRICGRSLIEPSAVSAPSDFLTSEGEYRRVWQVRYRL